MLTTFNEGADILVVEEIDETWYSIAYQAKIGYVKKADTKDKVIDTQAVDEEMAAEQYESDLWVEELERDREEKSRSVIWGVVIAVLIIAMFGVGIGGAVMGRAKEKSEEKQTDPDIKEEK